MGYSSSSLETRKIMLHANQDQPNHVQSTSQIQYIINSNEDSTGFFDDQRNSKFTRIKYKYNL